MCVQLCQSPSPSAKTQRFFSSCIVTCVGTLVWYASETNRTHKHTTLKVANRTSHNPIDTAESGCSSIRFAMCVFVCVLCSELRERRQMEFRLVASVFVFLPLPSLHPWNVYAILLLPTNNNKIHSEPCTLYNIIIELRMCVYGFSWSFRFYLFLAAADSLNGN